MQPRTPAQWIGVVLGLAGGVDRATYAVAGIVLGLAKYAAEAALLTAWDEPRRLAFDVTSQPDPMVELTPWRHVHPPHLHDQSLRSRHVIPDVQQAVYPQPATGRCGATSRSTASTAACSTT